MYAVRRWSVRHARGMEIFYALVERFFVTMHPVWSRLGYARLEKPVAGVEKMVKGFLFDCQMCGQCALSSTGMSCPMNCPKNLRNGPCGGVRANGGCEVKPEMRCVWVDAVEGSQRMVAGKEAIKVVQFAVDRRLQGHSTLLRIARDKSAAEKVAP